MAQPTAAHVPTKLSPTGRVLLRSADWTSLFSSSNPLHLQTSFEVLGLGFRPSWQRPAALTVCSSASNDCYSKPSPLRSMACTPSWRFTSQLWQKLHRSMFPGCLMTCVL